ncbi:MULTISPECIES: response regulator [Sediminispirochaeta]|jgi:CheY-like chemotaxis protein|uniref:Response regulator receiver protein n=1 Tax=Sediminispirochaeta smaragdinae (strain DSM 11293 / JCM 15392 / SEBR 4228) TaxID=573413 RepID=E1R1Q7_SEDSS|nr:MULTISPECIES: response regulator [Sediminispirochaeta]ADK81433.1 response regulator receiver protein [Sediminispirochaeta smaragdinae DSM 11293]
MAKLLIIDDSFVARMMIRKVLESADHEVLEASDGNEGMILIEEKKPDAVLLDLLMPGESGEAVLLRLRKHFPSLPVIVLSADIQETTRERCIRSGANGFVSKPPHPDTLLPAVAMLFQSTR